MQGGMRYHGNPRVVAMKRAAAVFNVPPPLSLLLPSLRLSFLCSSGFSLDVHLQALAIEGGDFVSKETPRLQDLSKQTSQITATTDLPRERKRTNKLHKEPSSICFNLPFLPTHRTQCLLLLLLRVNPFQDAVHVECVCALAPHLVELPPKRNETRSTSHTHSVGFVFFNFRIFPHTDTNAGGKASR